MGALDDTVPFRNDYGHGKIAPKINGFLLISYYGLYRYELGRIFYGHNC